ncbi:GTP-binding protein [uncultured Oribacterium sp.]|uniref:CobW family GTP-binding protein n=1 Tax=uncultured Oribacterium sp. TaxID=462198 RepID=UPI00280434A4|nr:GTP-binding protein [uncultured Oribacterium sp.]
MTKIDIISGFLGAGKTTFIQKLLSDALKGENVVLIENEFGEIGVDSGFLKNAGIEIREMNQGCICCSLVGDFESSLKEVIEQYHPDRILIEPSGVGKLSDILSAVKTVSENLDVKLDGAVTVVDATKAKLYNKNFGEFFDDQIRFATSVVLSRMDIASGEKAEEAINIVRGINPHANLITTGIAELSGEKLLEIIGKEENLEEELLAEVKAKAAHHHEHHHDHEHHHEHHHEHGESCGCGCHEEEHEHHHEHHHEHGESCGCGCHDHDHEEEHEHHHDHEHGESCGCGCHDHEEEHHHHHHHEGCGCGHDHDADEIFDSIGLEVFKKVDRSHLEEILEEMVDGCAYGSIVRAKGMLACTDGTWVNFDLVPEQVEIREAGPENIGKFVVIGTELQKDKIKALFND